MRHPAIRFLLAAMTAALSASLVMGTALAEGPVPEQPPVVIEGTPSGTEEVRATNVTVVTVVTDEGTSSFTVTTPEDAAFFGVALMSQIQITCKKAHHTLRHGDHKLEAELRFCWNVSHPPSEITSHDRYKAVATTKVPKYVVGSPWHRKWDGGAGFTYVDTKAKGSFCAPSLQEDLTWVCEGYDHLYIDAEHKVGGATKAWGTITYEPLN